MAFNRQRRDRGGTVLMPKFTSEGLKAILCAVIGCLLLWGLYSTITAPRKARQEAAQATASATTSQASMKAAQDALHITVETQAAHGRIDLVTQGNRDAILAAPGATEALGSDLNDAGLRALCLRDTYRLQPACVELLHADPKQP